VNQFINPITGRTYAEAKTDFWRDLRTRLEIDAIRESIRKEQYASDIRVRDFLFLDACGIEPYDAEEFNPYDTETMVCPTT
jgi:hypothetical protein